MEKFNDSNNLPESPKEKSSVESAYNFPEIMESLKIGMKSLVLELKDMIEHGEYNTLISDEAAARLPTLILKDIIMKKAPNGKGLNTYFLALGEGYRPDKDMDIDEEDESYRRLLLDTPKDFILRKKDTLQKTLIVTEHIHEGGTILQVMREFNEVGYTNYDIATVSLYDKGIKNCVEKEGHRFFSGNGVDITKRSSKGIDYKRLSGVRKEAETPMYQDEKFRRMIYGAHPVKRFGNWSKYEKEEQDNVNKARKDIKILAQEIIDEVWKSKADIVD